MGYMPKIGELDQALAKAALSAAIQALLNGGLESVTAVEGRWTVKATRDVRTGYNLNLRAG